MYKLGKLGLNLATPKGGYTLPAVEALISGQMYGAQCKCTWMGTRRYGDGRQQQQLLLSGRSRERYRRAGM